ncbi:MAG: hypothetical protein CMI29_08510 [Opitutae bacterium]|nr:hypothetical protein [Opitutae bacterium]
MSTRLDEVLAVGMARMSVAPVPTGTRPLFDKSVYQSITNGVKEIVSQEKGMDDYQLHQAMRRLVSSVRREHNISDDKDDSLYRLVRQYRRAHKGREMTKHFAVTRLPKTTYLTVNLHVKELVEREGSLSDEEVRQEMEKIARAIMNENNLPESEWRKVRANVQAARRRVPGYRQLAQHGDVVAQPIDVPQPPQHVIEEEDELQERLATVESELEDLLGEKAMPMPRYIYLEPYGRMLVAKFFNDPEKEGALEELANNLELSKEETMVVVEAEAKRITEAAFLNDAARKQWGPKIYENVVAYVNTAEQLSSRDSTGSLKTLRLKIANNLKMDIKSFEGHVAVEKKRRNKIQIKRDQAIDLQIYAHAGSKNSASSSSDAKRARFAIAARISTLPYRMAIKAKSPDFQAVLAVEAREPRYAEELKRNEEDEFLRSLLDNPGSGNSAWVQDVLAKWNPAFDYDALLAEAEGVLEGPAFDYDALLAEAEGVLEDPSV